MKKWLSWMIGAGLAMAAAAGTAAVAEDFMMMAVRRTMEGDAERIAKHLFPRQDFVSVKTLPADVAMKEIHPRRMVVMMTEGVKIELMLTGKVHRKNTGGRPYTIEVVRVSDIKCTNIKMKNMPLLPEGAAKALEELPALIVEEARKAALIAYPDEKVESVTTPKLQGKDDRRTGAVTVRMSQGIQVDLEGVGGYVFDPKTNNIKPEWAGFTQAAYTRNGQKDTPTKTIDLVEKQ